MPLDEQGQKWSCEPCLRGHRSSKCKHFDRLMARVAKSGRPSKACPHGRLYCDCRKSYAVMERLASDSVRPLYHVGESEQYRSGMAESTTIASAPSYPVLNTPLQPALIVPEPSGHAGMNLEGSESDIQFERDHEMWQYQYATLEHLHPIDPSTSDNHNHELSPPENSSSSLPLLQDDLLLADMYFVPDLSPQQLH